MKKIFISLITLLLSYNSIHSQNNKIGNILFEYCVGKIGNLHALIYLYKSENKKDLINLDALKEFSNRNALNISFEQFAGLNVTEDSENNITILFGLMNEGDIFELNDSLKIEQIECEILLGEPLSEGSSIRTLDGKIIKGIVRINDSNKIELNDYEYESMMIVRADISGIKESRIKLSNEYESGTPEWVYREATNKYTEEDYVAYVKYLSAVDLDSVKTIFDEIVKLDTTGQFINTLLPSISSYEEFSQMSAKQFMIELFAIMAKYNPQIVETQLNIKTTIIGKIYEDDYLCHIVIRETYKKGDNDLSMVDVKTLKKIENKWYMTLQNEIVKMVYKLKNSFMKR